MAKISIDSFMLKVIIIVVIIIIIILALIITGIVLLVANNRHNIKTSIQQIDCGSTPCTLQVKYTVDGKPYIANIPVANPSLYTQGQIIDIHYDSNNPSNAIIHSWTNTYVGASLLGVGLILVALSIWAAHHVAQHT